jgi:aspartate/methionine/tyrosine aminotransferase
MKRKGAGDVEEFRKLVLRETGVSFCTRKHFGRPLPGETEQYIRFAYSGIDAPLIKEGMKKLADFLS